MLIDAEKLKKTVKSLYIEEVRKDDYTGKTINITIGAVLRLIELHEEKEA